MPLHASLKRKGRRTFRTVVTTINIAPRPILCQWHLDSIRAKRRRVHHVRASIWCLLCGAVAAALSGGMSAQPTAKLELHSTRQASPRGLRFLGRHSIIRSRLWLRQLGILCSTRAKDLGLSFPSIILIYLHHFRECTQAAYQQTTLVLMSRV